MDNQVKQDVFLSFAQKAAKKIEERKKKRCEKIYIPDLEETITITAMTDQEFIDINEFSDDSNKNDSYMIYMSSPELQHLAKELVEQGAIREHIEVVNMFRRADKRAIAQKILELSGIYEESTIEVISEVAEIKNL